MRIADSYADFQTGGQFIKEALERNRMQSAEIAAKARLEAADKVASEVHFIPEHMKQKSEGVSVKAA